MFHKILVCVDLNHEERANQIIERAKALKAPNAVVILLNVVELIPTYVEAYLPQGALDGRAKEAKTKLETLAGDADLEASISVRIGSPQHDILAEAEKSDVDLIMIASHHPGLEDYLIGSTAARVVRHAQCSVLVDRR